MKLLPGSLSRSLERYLSKQNRKGQIFSVDVAIAIITFIFILVGAIYISEQSQARIAQTEERNGILQMTQSVATVLLETPGDPSNWTNISTDDFNATNIMSLGLARSKSMANYAVYEKGRTSGLANSSYLSLEKAKAQKMQDFNATNYDDYKRILGVLGAFEFYTEIKTWQSGAYESTYTFGSPPPSTASQIAQVTRLAYINDTWGLVEIRGWKNCPHETC